MWNNLMQGFGQNPMGGSNTFQQTYRCRSVAFHKPEMERTGKICLPPSALDMLMRLNIQYPMLFEVLNQKTQQLTHCGVLEFTAEEGICYMPYWMMQYLLVEEGGFIEVRNVSLPRGTFVKLQPHSKRFLDISDPKAVLEIQLRNYSCLTKGEVIAFYYLDEPYYMNVVEVKPATYNAISIVETDLQLDFDPPVDYVEPVRPAAKSPPTSSSSSTPSSGSKKRAAGKQSSPAASVGYRLDGKPTSGSATSSPYAPGSTPDKSSTSKLVSRKVVKDGVLVEEMVPADDGSDSSSSTDSSEEEQEAGDAAAFAAPSTGSSSFIPFQGQGRTLK